MMPARRNIKYAKSLNAWQGLALIAIGVLSGYLPAVVSLIWLGIIVVTLYAAANNNTNWIWYGFAASPALELWVRMARSPLVPYEIGKYYMVLVIGVLFALHIVRTNPYPQYKIGQLILLLLIPSSIVGIVYFNFENWVMDLLGIIELALMLIISAREKWTTEHFCRVMHFALIPVLPVLGYLMAKTPKLDKVNFALGSNFKTSGDFGANQVSTILGMGIVLTTVLLILHRPLFKYKWFNYLLIALLLFRGLLTFSRGGMISAAIAILIALLPFMFSSIRRAIQFGTAIAIVALLSVLIFNKVNDITGNQLLLRYKGETAGTLAGTKKRTLNTITSYRIDIVESDWRMFKKNWAFGVGPGMSQELRPKYGFLAIAPHTEYTRLLSEHGLGGLFTALALIVFPLSWIKRQKLVTWKAIIGCLYAYALLTCLHSAMRTNTTVVCFVLASIPVYFINTLKEAKRVE